MNLHSCLAHRCTRGLSVHTISNHLPEEDKCGVRKTRLTCGLYASTYLLPRAVWEDRMFARQLPCRICAVWVFQPFR